MNKREGFIVIFIGLIVLFAGLSMASFTTKGNNLVTQYSAGQNIEGTINISLTDESADSLFTSNFNGSITLVKLLEANKLVEGTDYACTKTGCGSSYKESGTSITSIALSGKDSFIVGFKITGDDITISSLKFSVNSSAENSCERQMWIDVLDKNESFIQSNKYTTNVDTCGEKNRGCFDSGASSSHSFIVLNTYCEKMTLEDAPAYQIGARITNETGTGKLTMSLQRLDEDTSFVDSGNCILSPPQTTQEVSCTVNHTIIKGNYLVCINADSDNSGYTIDRELTNPFCGSVNGQEPYTRDFNIFAQPREFAAIGTINVNKSIYSEQNFGEDLGGYADRYLEEEYQRNCSKGCFIPFKFISGISQSQTLTFSNAQVMYSTGGEGTSEESLYKLNVEKSIVKTPTNKPVNLEIKYAGFKIPITSTANKLSISLGGKPIVTNLAITVTPGFEFDIYPKNVSFGAITNFQAITTENITSSSWDFGDGTTGTSSGKFISHRYTTYKSGGYAVKVELTRKDGRKATASFDVSFGSLSEAANSLLNEYDIRIANLTKDINSFSSISPLISTNLKIRFNITSMQNSLNASRRMISNASYVAAINSILLIDAPASLDISEKGVNIPLEFGFGNMNVGHIKDLSPASSSSDEDLKKAISSWFNKNYDANINYEIISKTTGDNNEKTPVLTDFRVSITKKTESDVSADDAHLIIGYPKDSIIFAGNYSAKPVGSGTDIPITGSTNVEFLIGGSIGVSTLGMYISPEIDKLSAYGAVEIVSKPGFNWGKFILWFGILLVFALAIYVFLQQWYKKRYESYLFKNPDELYNLINFIYTSRKAGLDDGEIGRKLRKANWKGEQVTYAFRKINGERTGMPSLPFFGFSEKKKMMEEIEKRKQSAQPGPSQVKQNLY